MPEAKYTKEHEWVRVEEGSKDAEVIGIVGITDFAQEQLGDIVFVELPEVGTTVEKGDEAATIESVKAASEFFTPVSGKIININEVIINDPGLINSDPLEVGWFFSIRLSDPAELKDLMDQSEYERFLNSLS
ncbi:MAG: glycine cleavage system protein GcvH [Pseudomonadota bacterium]|nr:glycine cleavage system protein GcvH [Pseudomonadota bacterium]